jgi:glycine oxidase
MPDATIKPFMPGPSDIVVVGAGIIGCAVAHELARRGASVQLVDQRHAGQGATQASAGILAPYIEAEAGDFLGLTVRSLQMYDGFVSGVVADSGVEVPYRRTGTLQVATDHDRMTTLKNIAARLDAQGVELDLLDAQTARAEEPQLGGDVVGGLLVPTHGFVSAEDLTRALTAAARRYGAQLIDGGRVRRIARCGSDLAVETDRGRLTGNAVVLAAGSWSGQIEIDGVGARIPVRPVRGQLIRLAWNGPTVRRVTWGDRYYLVPWDDGTLLVGATVEDAGFDEHTTVAGIRDLLDAACELVPHAWTAGFLGARAGLRPASADDLPILGPSRVLPNLMYATGHYRNGILLAPLTARLVADAMLENLVDPAMAKFGPGRFGEL